MQKDIADIKSEIVRLKETTASNDGKILYSLGTIEDKLNTREEAIGSTLRNVDERLADVTAQVASVPRQSDVESWNPAATAGAAAPAAPAASGVRTGAGAAAGIAPEQLFVEAMRAWEEGNIDRTQSKCEQFLQMFPNHPRAGEAQFWIGECFYSKEQYPQAIQAYQKVIEQYPGSRMESEAAAKIGYCYYREGDAVKARQALQTVVDRYPTYNQIDRVKETLQSLQPR